MNERVNSLIEDRSSKNINFRHKQIETLKKIQKLKEHKLRTIANFIAMFECYNEVIADVENLVRMKYKEEVKRAGKEA